MEGNSYKVCTELCATCENRAIGAAFEIYHCEYALAKGKCRLDPQGMCSHYEPDENYDPEEARRRIEAVRLRNRKYKEEHKVKSERPRGRPKVRE